MYWVVFSVFSVVDTVAGIIMGFVPFYWLAKCVFLVWCMSPVNGASIIYNKIVLPWFKRYQNNLDQAVIEGRKAISKFSDEPIDTGTAISLVNLMPTELQ